jgi:hypothetical protein
MGTVWGDGLNCVAEPVWTGVVQSSRLTVQERPWAVIYSSLFDCLCHVHCPSHPMPLELNHEHAMDGVICCHSGISRPVSGHCLAKRQPGAYPRRQSFSSPHTQPKGDESLISKQWCLGKGFRVTNFGQVKQDEAISLLGLFFPPPAFDSRVLVLFGTCCTNTWSNSTRHFNVFTPLWPQCSLGATRRHRTCKAS